MAGPLLIDGDLKTFTALGAAGSSIYSQAPQIRSAIRRQLGPETADILAVPQTNEAGDRIDWYAPLDGFVVPWSAATEEERGQAREELQRARAAFMEAGERLLASAGASDSARTFARMLPLALRIPSEAHIFLVGGRPVVTFWGFADPAAIAETDVIAALAMPIIAKPPPEVAAEPALAVAGAEPARRSWLWWLLALLLLALVLALLLFGLRSCDDKPAIGELPQPSSTMPMLPALHDRVGSVPPAENGAVPVDMAGDVRGREADVLLRSGGGAHETVLPEGTFHRDPSANSGLAADAETPAATGGPRIEPSLPRDADTGLPPPGAEDALPPGIGAPPDASAPPLVIPPELAGSEKGPLPQDKLSFLDGAWKSYSALMDSHTGKPIDVEYKFDGGKGATTIVRSDGVTCTGPASGSMSGGRLIITQDGDAHCSDGSFFAPTRVECQPGAAGTAARCRGINQDGRGYSVELTR